MPSSPVLLIEDTPSLQLVYEQMLREAGFEVHSEATAGGGLAAFRRLAARVVLLDLMLPDRDGLDLMQQMLAERPETNVIVITANGSINKAVQAVRNGAFDFLVKPFEEQRFLNAVCNAFRAASPPGQPPEPASRGAFIGSSGPMRTVYGRIESVARSMATVFITGESGTGKEICAQTVHDLSTRASGPFVPLNCGAIPSDLLESEVFGHLKGAFTGAIADKTGAAAAADGGTLFLDEVCEMDLSLQTKLLRFLQTSMIQPVGATRARKVDVRIVCATNRDPLEAVRAGRFREDLYYRLHVVPIHMPPLRDRGADVIEIAEDALRRFSREEGRAFTGLAPDVAELFQTLPWPGNVRQVLNVVRNVVVLHEGGTVTRAMLPVDLTARTDSRMDPRIDTRSSGRRPDGTDHPSGPDAGTAADGRGRGNGAVAPADTTQPDHGAALDTLYGKSLAEIERLVIEEAIARNGGSIPRAARVLEVSPSTLYRKREGWAKQAPSDPVRRER